MNISTTVYSPLGTLLLVGEEAAGGIALVSVSFTDAAPGPAVPAFADLERQFAEYFAGHRSTFDLDPAPRGTAFQRQVWDAVDAIPYGETTTYGAIAARVGAPRDRIRAVGAAIGANPLLIVRPCHRVIGADGSLTGYAGGPTRKRELLVHEGALQPQLI